jgi:hypothetical protein
MDWLPSSDDDPVAVLRPLAALLAPNETGRDEATVRDPLDPSSPHAILDRLALLLVEPPKLVSKCHRFPLV